MRDKTQNKKSNFFYAFALLPKEKREALNVFYSFSRISDEIVDEEEVPTEIRLNRFEKWESDFRRALNGTEENELLSSLVKVINKFDIPKTYFFELLNGIKSDLYFSQPETIEELERYAYSVASTVGLIIIHILGFEYKETEEYAVDLGKALQFTNIIRDVKIDFENDRVYIPKELMRQYNFSKSELKDGIKNKSVLMLLKKMGFLADEFYRNAWNNFRKEEYKTLYPAQAMGRIYYELLNKIKSQNFDVFRNKISISTSAKLKIVFSEIIKGKLHR
jgi:phytoene synthase